MKRFLLKRGSPRKSQAVSELAIFGGLIIAAFAAMLSYIQSTNSQQALQMRAFRKAMQLSRELNKEVSYTIVKDTPVVDVSDPFGRPDLSRQTISSTVVAVADDPLFPDDDDPDDRGSVQYYEFNGKAIEVEPVFIQVYYPDGNTSSAWIAAPISDVEYQTQKQRPGTLSRHQAGAAISTTPTGSVTTQSTTNLVLEERGTFEENYLKELQSNIDREPWQKRFRLEENLADLGSYLQYLVTVLRWPDPDETCGPSHTVRDVIIGGASLFVSTVFNYIFQRNPHSNNKPNNVVIISSYETRVPISHSASFDQPAQTFSVSQ